MRVDVSEGCVFVGAIPGQSNHVRDALPHSGCAVLSESVRMASRLFPISLFTGWLPLALALISSVSWQRYGHPRRREWDSNPRSLRSALFRSAAIGRSATPPRRMVQDSNLRGELAPNAFRERCLKPLGQPSGSPTCAGPRFVKGFGPLRVGSVLPRLSLIPRKSVEPLAYGCGPFGTVEARIKTCTSYRRAAISHRHYSRPLPAL